MSVSGKLVLAIKMLLESQQYKAELNQAVSDTQAAAAKVEGTTKGIHEAVQSAVQGQSAVVRGAAGALVSMGAVAGTAVVAAAAVGLAYHEAGKETKAYEKAIISTGNAAGVTAGQLADMARGIDSVAGTQATAAAALATMTATGQVARENLQKVSLAAVEMERATGQSITDTAKIFESLGDAPVKASARLNESMNYLTAGTYAQIKAADELGDKETAASIAQNAAADALRERAARMEQHLGTLERAWRGVRDFAKEAWDAMLNVGREQTSGEKLETVRKRIADLENKIAASGGFGETAGGAATGRPNGTARMQAELQGLQAQAAALAGAAYQASESANAERERAAAVKASIALSDEAGKRDSELEKTRKAVAQATQQYTTAIKNEGLTQQERAQIEANYLKVVSDLTKVKEKSAAARKVGQTEEEREAATIANLAGLTGDYQQKLKELQSARAKGNISEEYYLELVEALIAKQPMAKQLMDAQTKATTAADKATLELAKARDKALVAQGKELEKAQAALVLQDEQNARLGLSKEAVAELDAAKLEMLATDLEVQASNALFLNQDGALYEVLIKQANAWREVARAKREGGAKQAGIDAAKEAEKEAKKASDEWERAGERIEQSLTDSLMRGFESGKTAAQNLRDTVKNMFKTLVLRPAFSLAMSPVSAGVQYLMNGGAPSSGGGGGLMGGIQTASNLNTLWGAGSQALYGASAGASAASLGYANLVGMAGGDAIGALATANGMWASVATGAQAAAQSAIAANLAVEAGTAAALPAGTLATATGGGATAGGGIMGALNSIPGWGWALAGVALLGTMLSKKQTLHSGAGAIYSADQGLQEGAGIYNQSTFKMGDVREYNKDGQALASGIAAGLGSTLDGIAKAFGQKAGFEVATAFADDTSKDGAWGALRISQGGKDLLNWQDTRTSRWAPKEFADGAEGQAQYLAAIANDTRKVLLDMDLPGWADTMLNRLGELSNMDQLSAAVAQIAQAQAAFEAFGQYMPTFAGLADSAISKLVDASGGVQALAGNMATFVELYTSDAEKLAVSTEAVRVALAKLGMDMPATREEYAAQVKANIALGDAGAKTVAGLLAVAGAFASATQAAEEAAQAERERASALRGAFAALADSLADMRGGVAAADARVAAVRMDIWAGYADAQQKVIDLEMQAADATRGFAQSLRGFVSDLATGPNGGMGLDARYQMLQQRFAETAARAGAGDQGARDALTGVASAYLDVARANARSGVEYARDAARVTAQLNKLASAAEADPLVQKYDAQTLTLQQQIADAQIDVVKHLALMEVAGVSTDLGIQTVDKTLQALRDEYVAATQEQAAANLKLDVALAALDALGLTEELVKAVAANQTNSLSVALGISDEALSSITGALGLTPENVADLGQQFAVEVALLVGQAATDLAAALDGALAYDPAQFDALRTIVGYDSESPDFAALHTILGFDLQSDKFRALGTVLGMAPEASAQVDALLGGIGFAPAAVGQLDLIAGGLGISDALVETIKRVAAGVGFTESAAAQAAQLTAGLAFADVAREQIALIAAGVSLTDAAGAQVDGLNAGVGWSADVAAQVQGLLGGVSLAAAASDQVNGLLAGLTLSAGASAQVDGLLAGLQLAAADRVTVQQLLGGIGFDADTVTALQDGLGLRAGLLPTLGTALGLSAEAAKAIGVLSGMGTIDQTVSNAYASIGRVGIGSAPNQIDQQGWDFWRGQLASGALSLAGFEQAFLESAAATVREQPGSALSDYVSPYLKKLGLPGFAVGTSAVPFDMVAQIHQGEEITPRPYVDAQAADRREANRLLAQLVEKSQQIKEELALIKGTNRTTADGITGIVNQAVTLLMETAKK
ncbi:prophage tail length tape measure [Acidovorax sp. KKS102]|uniref:phage tail length tape measure family protein n=1 Tax=Acidovorax sp. KKS102 TaxID=358220 RepID=UPI00028ACAB0|nr:phage tail length tape measure family protein [Acidovorax sp. KKS102]AFU45666.1 prophage tail length tape measure [Acidovorax sp. KKS102]